MFMLFIDWIPWTSHGMTSRVLLIYADNALGRNDIGHFPSHATKPTFEAEIDQNYLATL
ncbi:MAG TPA: hypothetical protein LFV66_05845 [Rickettsia endosymbiont of Bembidion lapponicum]|nr:hypothetical protein [Rickettsia endosymbiont of Bembidion lapponicum]